MLLFGDTLPDPRARRPRPTSIRPLPPEPNPLPPQASSRRLRAPQHPQRWNARRRIMGRRRRFDCHARRDEAPRHHPRRHPLCRYRRREARDLRLHRRNRTLARTPGRTARHLRSQTLLPTSVLHHARGELSRQRNAPFLAFGRHSCSLKWKGDVLDQTLAGVTRGLNARPGWRLKSACFFWPPRRRPESYGGSPAHTPRSSSAPSKSSATPGGSRGATAASTR